MIRLLVVDDHPIVLEGLVTVLQDEPDFEVAGAASSGEEAIALAQLVAPDVIVLDLELGGPGGAAAIPELIRAGSGVRVLVFTAYSTDEQVLGALHAGARGYLLKGAGKAEIAAAIRAVHAGAAHLDPRVAPRILARCGGAHAASGPHLSPREREVLRFVGEGCANKQIARALGIAERTVKFHVTSILKKLEAGNRAQAVAIALQSGLLGRGPE